MLKELAQQVLQRSHATFSGSHATHNATVQLLGVSMQPAVQQLCNQHP